MISHRSVSPMGPEPMRLRIKELDSVVQNHLQLGNIDQANSVAQIVSGLSAALILGRNNCTDPTTGNKYNLQKCRLLGGGTETLEDAKKIYNEANSLWFNDKHPEALEQFQRSRDIREKLAPGSLVLAESYDGIARAYNLLNKPSEALEYYEKALQIIERLAPNSHSLFSVHNAIGSLHKSQKKFKEALVHYERCLLIREQMKSESLDIAKCHGELGGIYKELGINDRALEHYQKNLDIKVQNEPNTALTAYAYGAMGAVYESKGDLLRALENLKKQHEIQKRLKPSDYFTKLTAEKISNLESKTGRMAATASQETALSQLELFALFNESNKIVENAKKLQAEKKFAEAIEEYKRGIAIYDRFPKDSPYSSHKVRIEAVMSMAYKDLGDQCMEAAAIDGALEAYLISAMLLDRIKPNTSIAAFACMHVAKAYEAKGDLPKALEYTRKQHAIASQLESSQGSGLLTLASKKIEELENQIGRVPAALSSRVEVTRREPEKRIAQSHDEGTLEDARTFYRAGICLLDDSKYLGAIKEFEKCLSIAERLAPRSLELAQIYDSMGISFLKEADSGNPGTNAAQDNFKKAYSAYAAGMRIRLNLNQNDLGIAGSYCNIAVCLLGQLDLPNAAENCREAYVVINHHLSDENQGPVSEATKQLFDVLNMCKTELSVGFGLNLETKDTAYCFEKIGNLYENMKKPQDALEMFQKSLEAYREVRVPGSSIGRLSQKIADLKNSLSAGPQRRLQVNEEEIPLFLRTNGLAQRFLPPEADAHLSDFLGRLNAFARSAQSQNTSVSIQEAAVSAKNFREKGDAFFEAKNFEESLKQYKSALLIFQQHSPDHIEVGALHSVIGGIYLNQGKLDQALVAFQASQAILEKREPNGLNILSCYNNIGSVYQSQGKFDEALTEFRKSLVPGRAPPLSPALADAHTLIGEVYRQQGKFDDALNEYVKSLSIIEHLEPNGLGAGNIYNNIGLIHRARGQFLNALEKFKQALTIYLQLDPSNPGVIDIRHNIALVYLDQREFQEASSLLLMAAEAQKKLAPHSLMLATIYNSLGGVYRGQGNLTRALEKFNESLAIRKQAAPESLDTAFSYNNIGGIYDSQGDPDKALQFYSDALRIFERSTPNSLDTVMIYQNIAGIYQNIGRLSEALSLYQKSAPILEGALASNHPRVIVNAYGLANTALKLNNYDLAMKAANAVIQKDPTFKYAYDTKGLVLHKQGSLEKALEVFDQALLCDPGYADAIIHRLDVIKEIEQKSNNYQKIFDEIHKAEQIQATDYDTKKIIEWKSKAREPKGNSFIFPQELELPKTDYKLGTEEFRERLLGIAASMQSALLDLKRQHEEHKVQVAGQVARLDIHDEQLKTIEQRLDLVEDNLTMIDRSVKVMTHRKNEIEALKSNSDQGDYFCALLSALESAYLTAQVMDSGEFQRKAPIYGKAASYIGGVLELIPVIGQAASKLLTGIAGVVDVYVLVESEETFKRIAKLASNVEDFDQIAMRIALELTLKNKASLVALNKAEVPKDWKTTCSAITGGLQDLMTEFVRDNKTQARVWGRLDAFKIIAHLQKEAVAQTYAQLKSQEAEATPKRRESVIAHSIVDGMDVSQIAAFSVQLDELVRECRNYSSSKPEKKEAAEELLTLLLQKVSGEVSSQKVFSHVDAALKKEDNPIFSSAVLESGLKVIFTRCHKLFASNSTISEGASFEGARSYYEKGMKYKSEGKFTESLIEFQNSLAIVNALFPRGELEANCRYAVGTAYYSLNKTEEAIKHLERGASIYEKLNNVSIEFARCCFNLGISYFDVDRLDDAQEKLEKCVSLNEKIAPNTKELAASYDTLGKIYKKKEMTKKALEAFQKGLDIRVALNPKSPEADSSRRHVASVKDEKESSCVIA